MCVSASTLTDGVVDMVMNFYYEHMKSGALSHMHWTPSLSFIVLKARIEWHQWARSSCFLRPLKSQGFLPAWRQRWARWMLKGPFPLSIFTHEAATTGDDYLTDPVLWHFVNKVCIFIHLFIYFYSQSPALQCQKLRLPGRSLARGDNFLTCGFSFKGGNVQLSSLSDRRL